MTTGKLGILAGGGPAPGINGVIAAAAARACFADIEVVGIMDGFRWLMQGDTSHVIDLNLDRVAGIHFRGGSVIGIHREGGRLRHNLEPTIATLEALGIDKLVCIGGDGTVCSAAQLGAAARGRIRVVHVPKTIDNDLPLRDDVPTFGFQTARDVGVRIVQNLMTDAETTDRWYFVVTQGRQAGHLALGIGKAAAANLTLIPEEFAGDINSQLLVDVLAGSIIKRASQGKRWGVAVLAEGLGHLLAESRSEKKNAFGGLQYSEFDLAGLLERGVSERLAKCPTPLSVRITPKDIGYELRCADPIPFDMEYTRDLGYLATKYLLEGYDGAMITIQRGQFHAIPFEEVVTLGDRPSCRVRNVDRDSENYKIAVRYMTRLRRDDFHNPQKLENIASVVGMTREDFEQQFKYVTENEPPRIQLRPDSSPLVSAPFSPS
jgi:6-phosphofructokinase 1